MESTMPRKPEPGSSERIRWFVDNFAIPWLRARTKLRSLSALARHAGLRRSTLYGWYARGRTPDRPELMKLLNSVQVAEADQWAVWLTIGLGRPATGPIALDGPIPVPFALDARAASTPPAPAEPMTRGRAEQLLEETVMRALAALPPGAEEAKRILDGGLRVVRDARQLGLATIFIAIAALLAATSRADAIDSGSSVLTDVQVQVLSSAIELLREARRRLKRAARRAVALPQPPLPPSPSLSAAALYGSIISLDDVRALLLEPTYHARAKKTG